MGGDRPAPTVTAFFEADARRDIEAIVALFAADAIVVDERQTWDGPEGIRAWQDGPASKYTYTTQITQFEAGDGGRCRAIGRIEGNFPGGTAELKWDFTISGELISRLEIAP